jgi:hypothetical protein
VDDLANYDYQEIYLPFAFLNAGVDFGLTTGNWQFGLLEELAYPISSEMETDVADTYPSVAFSLDCVLSCVIAATV